MYAGRKDEQVKVRGYRMELGEIEAALRQAEGVKEGVVLVKNGKGGEKQLVGYVVSEGAEWQGTIPLREQLSRRLPMAMVPALLLQMDSLPVNANGKIDRRALQALPIPQEHNGATESEADQAHTPLEEIIAYTWAEVLHLEMSELQGDFFSLGGHSLLATQVISRLRQLLGIEVPLRILFEAPTLQKLAARLQQELRKGQLLSAPSILPVPRTRDLPLSYAQQRMWFLHQFDPGSAAYNISSAVRLHGQMDRSALAQALSHVIQRHESLRTSFPEEQGRPIVQIAPAPTTGLVTLDLRFLATDEREREIRRLAQQEAEQPFDLARGPLLRVWLLQVARQDQVLLLSMHHIISDGWSNTILVRELTSLYTALHNGETATLPELQVQYADYASWQHQWLQGKTLETLITYWSNQLNGAKALELPTDRPRLASGSNRGAIYKFTLPSQLSQDLAQLSRKEGVTLFMTLLAAFQVLLHRYTKQEDIVVGTDIANRTHREIEEIIGFFVNLLALRTQLSPRETFREVLKHVSSMLLNAYAHQDLPFEQIVDALQMERSGSRTPLVNVLFVMQDDLLPAIALQHLQVDVLDVDNHTAKFDLAVFLVEGPQALRGVVNYRTDLFDSSTIAHLFERFQILLGSILASPDAALKDLGIYSEEERAQQAEKELSRRETDRSKLKVARRDAVRFPDAGR